MRREGYEFAVSKPEVLYKTDERGKKLEPMEIAYVDVPEEFSGTVIQKLSERKGELQGMSTASDGTVRLEFHIPSRGLIGFRGEFLTSTKVPASSILCLTDMLLTREISSTENRDL